MKYIKEFNNYEDNAASLKEIERLKKYISFLVEKLKIKYYKEYPISVFLTHKHTNDILIEQDNDKNLLKIHYNKVWVKIKNKFPSINDEDVVNAIKELLEDKFKIKLGGVVSHPTGEYHWKWETLQK